MIKRNQRVAGLLAFLLFGGGAVVGALGHRYYASTVVNASEDWRKQYVSEMQSKLSLAPAQVDSLETILDETKAKYKAVRDEYRPAMLAVKEEQIRRVKAILKPDQIPGYEQLLAERERKSREQEEIDRQQEQKRAAERAAAKAARH
jgi:hypothetical protein